MRPDETQLIVTPHDRQTHPVAYINGRTGWFTGDCSSHASTRPFAHHMMREHFFSVQHHIFYPSANGIHAYSRRWRQRTGWDIKTQLDRLAADAGRPVDVVAHSMACLLLWEAAWRNLESVRRIVLIAPAMSHKANWDHLDFEQMLVLTNTGDRALFWGNILPWHPYGLAGRRGFAVEDQRIRHVNIPDKAKADIHRHSHYFRDPAIYDVGTLVDDFLTDTNP